MIRLKARVLFSSAEGFAGLGLRRLSCLFFSRDFWFFEFWVFEGRMGFLLLMDLLLGKALLGLLFRGLLFCLLSLGLRIDLGFFLMRFLAFYSAFSSF